MKAYLLPAFHPKACELKCTGRSSDFSAFLKFLPIPAGGTVDAVIRKRQTGCEITATGIVPDLHRSSLLMKHTYASTKCTAKMKCGMLKTKYLIELL